MESNPEGVCEAQDLRGDSKILFEIPTLRVALRVRLAIKLLAQDDAQRHCFEVNDKSVRGLPHVNE